MAAPATSPRPSPAVRRAPSQSASPANSIARGATARSAISHKVNASINGVSRRPSTSRPSPAASTEAGDAKDELLSALKRETDEKEELLVRLQGKEQIISDLTTENNNLGASLNTAEARLTELYTEQARTEEETSARLDLVDMLRAQVLELEREKRDVIRRYNEQTATFDAERQSFFDNEQHLKSRIQSLIQARKNSEDQKKEQEERQETLSIAESTGAFDAEEHEQAIGQHDNGASSEIAKADAELPRDDHNEPAEMTALRLELSTLSTSYSSLQNTVQLLSSQLLDLRRVNKVLQEENESYNILLREKTLNGQFDILRTVGTKDSDEGSDTDEEDLQEDDPFSNSDQHSVRSADRTTLDPVDELPEDMELSQTIEDKNVEDSNSVASVDRERSRRTGRGGSRRTVVSSRSPVGVKGESLANLPISGPGLDLAAELGRAENQAILGRPSDTLDARPVVTGDMKKKRSKRMSAPISDAKQDTVQPGKDVDALRSEVKSLKDANKALSLYASKIIDRIVLTGGFEHVLAADFEKPTPASPVKLKSPKKVPTPESSPQKKPRPQSTIFARTFSSEPGSTEPVAQKQTSTSPSPPAESTSAPKEKRRSMSFDWRSFTMFGSTEKKPEANPHLRPLTLRPGSSVVGARRLDTHEDEEDKRERERMNATLKLMGIEKPQTPSSPSHIVKSFSPPTELLMSASNSQSSDISSPKSQTSRFSFFRTRSSTSDTASAKSGSSTPNLTQEALEHAEAQTTLAALDEREKVLSVEMAKGAGGGFTELPRRQRGEGRSRRSKRSGESGSGSTVWSAGMSTHRETDSGDEGVKTDTKLDDPQVSV